MVTLQEWLNNQCSTQEDKNNLKRIAVTTEKIDKDQLKNSEEFAGGKVFYLDENEAKKIEGGELRFIRIH